MAILLHFRANTYNLHDTYLYVHGLLCKISFESVFLLFKKSNSISECVYTLERIQLSCSFFLNIENKFYLRVLTGDILFQFFEHDNIF